MPKIADFRDNLMVSRVLFSIINGKNYVKAIADQFQYSTTYTEKVVRTTLLAGLADRQVTQYKIFLTPNWPNLAKEWAHFLIEQQHDRQETMRGQNERLKTTAGPTDAEYVVFEREANKMAVDPAFVDFTKTYFTALALLQVPITLEEAFGVFYSCHVAPFLSNDDAAIENYREFQIARSRWLFKKVPFSSLLEKSSSETALGQLVAFLMSDYVEKGIKTTNKYSNAEQPAALENYRLVERVSTALEEYAKSKAGVSKMTPTEQRNSPTWAKNTSKKLAAAEKEGLEV